MSRSASMNVGYLQCIEIEDNVHIPGLTTKIKMGKFQFLTCTCTNIFIIAPPEK